MTQLPADPSEMLRRAADALKKQELTEAATILRDLLKSDPNNADAWYLLSFALSDDDKKQKALERALAANPAYDRAQQRLNKLRAAKPLDSLSAVPTVSPVAQRPAPDASSLSAKIPPTSAPRQAGSNRMVLVGGALVVVVILAILLITPRQSNTPPTATDLDQVFDNNGITFRYPSHWAVLSEDITDGTLGLCTPVDACRDAADSGSEVIERVRTGAVAISISFNRSPDAFTKSLLEQAQEELKTPPPPGVRVTMLVPPQTASIGRDSVFYSFHIEGQDYETLVLDVRYENHTTLRLFLLAAPGSIGRYQDVTFAIARSFRIDAAPHSPSPSEVESVTGETPTFTSEQPITSPTPRLPQANLLADVIPALEPLVISPDGKRLAGVNLREKRIYLLDVDTGQPLPLANGATAIDASSYLLNSYSNARAFYGVSLHFSPDGSVLALATSMGGIVLWDAQTGVPLKAFKDTQMDFRTVQFSADGHTLIAGAPGVNQLRRLDVLSGTIQSLPLSGCHNSFNPDFTQCALISNQSVEIWDVNLDAPVRTVLLPDDHKVGAVFWSRTGKYIIAIGLKPISDLQKTIWVMDAETLTVQQTYSFLTRYDYPMVTVLTADDRFLIRIESPDRSGYSDVVVFSDLRTGETLGRIETTVSIPVRVALDTAGIRLAFLAETYRGATLQMWDVAPITGNDSPAGSVSGTTLASELGSGASISTMLQPLTAANAGDITLLTQVEDMGHTLLSPDGKLLLAGTVLWNLETMNRLSDLPIWWSFTTWPLVRFSANSSAILYLNKTDNTVRLWDITQNADSLTMPRPVNFGGWYAYVSSADGHVVAILTAGDVIRVWDTVTRQQIALIQALSETRQLIISDDGSRLFTFTNSQMQVWELPEGKPGFSTAVDNGYNLSLSAGGTVVGVVDRKAPISTAFSLWDIGTGKLISDSVASFAFSPDGKFLSFVEYEDPRTVPALLPRTVVIDLRSGQRTELVIHKADIAEVFFSPDGRLMLTHTSRTETRQDRVYIYDLNKQTTIFVDLPTDRAQIEQLVVSDEGQYLVFVANPSIIWDTATGNVVGQFTGDFRSAVFGPDGLLVLIGNTSQLSTVSTPHMLKDLLSVQEARFALDDKLLLLRPIDAIVDTWDIYGVNMGR